MPRMLSLGLVAALALTQPVLTSPASAQVGDLGPDETSARAVDAARLYWSTKPPPTPSECEQARAAADEGTIVVCREWEDGTRYMLGDRTRAVTVGADLRDTAGGAPRAPDFNESCLHTRGRANCMMLGSVPPPAIMVDFDALPETPAGSEAALLYGGPTADDAVEEEQTE